jgi:hypothetical protein
MTVCEYANEVRANLNKYGNDGSIVFNSNVSDALIKCFNIMSAYATARSRKTIPIPFSIVCKCNDCNFDDDNANYASFKFGQDENLNINMLNQIVSNLGLMEWVHIEPYSTCVNIEFLQPVRLM